MLAAIFNKHMITYNLQKTQHFGKLTLLNKAQRADIFWMSMKTPSKPMNHSRCIHFVITFRHKKDFQ